MAGKFLIRTPILQNMRKWAKAVNKACDFEIVKDSEIIELIDQYSDGGGTTGEVDLSSLRDYEYSVQLVWVDKDKYHLFIGDRGDRLAYEDFYAEITPGKIDWDRTGTIDEPTVVPVRPSINLRQAIDQAKAFRRKVGGDDKMDVLDI